MKIPYPITPARRPKNSEVTAKNVIAAIAIPTVAFAVAWAFTWVVCNVKGI